MSERDFVMLGGEAYDSETGEIISGGCMSAPEAARVVEFPGNRIRIRTAPPPGAVAKPLPAPDMRADGKACAVTDFRPMAALDKMPPGTKVRLDVGEHPLGPIVIGWRAIGGSSGPVYYTWDKSARAHVTVKPSRWAPLNAIGPGVA